MSFIISEKGLRLMELVEKLRKQGLTVKIKFDKKPKLIIRKEVLKE